MNKPGVAAINAGLVKQSQNTILAIARHEGDSAADYSAFTVWQKRWIVFIAAFAAWFSTASSFLFFPAIDALARGLDTSTQRINLTVTSYLIVAGFAPVFTAGFSDKVGRRPAFIASFTIYLSANIGLAEQRSFAALFVLRMLQSAGVAGTFAIAYGVLADIATPAERGSYVGVVAFCTNTAPSIGPIIAAVLNSSLGWPSIFWFLVISSGLWLLIISITLPETLRSIVGDGGSTPANALLHRVPFKPMRVASTKTLDSGSKSASEASAAADAMKQSVLANLKMVLNQKDKVLVIMAIAILYTVWNCLQASLSTLFIQIYRFTYLQSGLIYIPFGIGVGFAGFFTGLLLDNDYRKTAQKHGLPISRRKEDRVPGFPLEEARFRSTFIPLAMVCVCLVAYGWCLQFHIHFAVALVLQLLLGASLQVCFTTLNTLLMDLDPNRAATAQAVSNFFRCLLAAGAIAVLDLLLEKIGEGWTFTMVAICASSCFVVFVVEIRHGQKWRSARI